MHIAFRSTIFLLVTSVTKECKGRNVPSYTVASFFVWVWNLVSHIKGRTQAEGVLREIFGPRRDGVTGSGWETCTVICVSCPTLLGWSSNRGCDGQDMWHVGKEEKCMQALGRET